MIQTKQDPVIQKQMGQIADLLTAGFDQGKPMIVIVVGDDTLQTAMVNRMGPEAAAVTLLLLAEDWLGQALLEGNAFACLHARQRVRTALKMLGAATYEEDEQ